MPDTQGPTRDANTVNDFGGSQTTSIWTPDIVVTAVPTDIYMNGTYQLRLDGVLINTRSGIGPGDGIDLLSGAGPIELPRGVHTWKITKTAGSAGWYFRSGGDNSWADDWYYSSYWSEAGGGEIVPLRITASKAPPTSVLSTSGTFTSGSTWSTATFDVEMAENRLLYGVSFSATTLSAYQLRINGTIVGTGPTVGAGSYTMPGPRSWVMLDDPFVLTKGDRYTLRIERSGGGSFSGWRYASGSSYSGSGFTVYDWIEGGGALYTPNISLLAGPADAWLTSRARMVMS